MSFDCTRGPRTVCRQELNLSPVVADVCTSCICRHELHSCK
jgi:hypothetical protein